MDLTEKMGKRNEQSDEKLTVLDVTQLIGHFSCD